MATTNIEQSPQVALIRHIVPVVAGVVVTVAMTVVTDAWLGARGVAPPLALAAAYRAGFTILGSHLAARLSPSGQPPLRYALALGVLLTAVNVAGVSAAWGLVPAWYVVAGIALPLPSALIGGALAVRIIASTRGANRGSP